MEFLDKSLTSIADVRTEIKYLKSIKVNSYIGYFTNREIKANITSNTGKVWVISYKIKGRYLYKELSDYLRKKELGRIA